MKEFFTHSRAAVKFSCPRAKPTRRPARERDLEQVQKIIATRERFTGQLREMGFQLEDSAANFLFITHPKKCLVVI